MLLPSIFLFLIPLVSSFPHHGGLSNPSVLAHRSANFPRNGNALDWNPSVWRAPGKGDVRSPCPILNTMANHELIPHGGRNITGPPFIKAVQSVLNFDEPHATDAFKTALSANPNPNATYFDLDMLHNTHNIFEHDGSLSRRDIVFDPTNSFDEATFSNFLSYLKNETTVNTTTIANARARHAYDMSRINPNFYIPEAGLNILMGEMAMLLSIFGDPVQLVAKREYIEYMYRNERFPVALGWSMSKTQIGPNIQNATEVVTKENPTDVPLAFTPRPSP